VPLQTAKVLCDAIAATGIPYKLVQQTRVKRGLSKVEGEALLTRFPIIETGNLDYQARDIVALVARLLIEERPVDFYVTHLYMSRGDDSLRLFQVQQLLQWIDIETADIPTEQGSPLSVGWRTGRDAASVAALREGGAVILGKVVTTEFAATEPRGARNPWNRERTPADHGDHRVTLNI
jgi:endonuclease/exonuclease/phosphatase family metal-dependent hydrolase